MRFLIDECTGRRVANWLIEQGHDVLVVRDISKGNEDENILKLAYEDNRILITMDRDFGKLVFREGGLHCGIIFLWLDDEAVEVRKQVLENVITEYADALINQLLVVTEKRVRVAQLPNEE